jgi:Tfp pilus assembly protein PilF
VERLAVLPFENLSADPALDWAGPALAGMLVDEVSASTRIYAYRAGDLGAARLTGATRVLQGYYSRSGGGLTIHAVVEDLRTRRNTKALEARGGVDSGFGQASESLARGIDDRTRPFGTANTAALRAWGEAQLAGDNSHRAEALQRAIAADPNFGAAYADLLQLYVSSGSPALAQPLVKQASDRLSQFTDLDRARFEYVLSGVRHDDRERREALMALSRLITTDTQTLQALAETELNGHRFDSAVDLFKSATAISPENATLWNELGYAESYRGNLAGARAALEQYRALQPAQANALDSLGEVHFFAGSFGEAATYFLEAERLQPGFLGGGELLKAAQARYLGGNLTEADGLYAQFDKLRRNGHDPVADIRKARWLYISGRRAEAVALAGASAKNTNPDIAAYAECHLSLWAMDAGDRTQALAHAAPAAQLAHNPGIQQLAALCRYLAEPSTQPVTPLAQGYASVFAKDSARAVTLLKPLYDQAGPASDGDVRTLYAWALAGAGRREEARPLLQRYYIPLGANEEGLISSQLFPRFLALRSSIAGSK